MDGRARTVAEPDPTLVGGDDGAADGQPEPRVAGARVSRRIGTVEGLEGQIAERWWEPGTVIGSASGL
ncbi:MAG: hypothetical protein FD127_2034 [Acidimicrobiaceae bacterium]|nr:MAG: hypothetical protein FD127_2034 [Acidimicrobiaceae bacterium]